MTWLWWHTQWEFSETGERNWESVCERKVESDINKSKVVRTKSEMRQISSRISMNGEEVECFTYLGVDLAVNEIIRS